MPTRNSIISLSSHSLDKGCTMSIEKDKINKIDLLGFICQKGNLSKDKVGMIAGMDFQSYVAIDRKSCGKLLPELRKHKIKGQKVRIAISK